MVLIIDTETTGLEGYPRDRVLEIGIAEYDELRSIKMITARYDIMGLATKEVMKRVRLDSIGDKELQRRLISEDDWFPGKLVRSEDAYRVLCSDDPMGLGMRQMHRALDDVVMEGWTLKAIIQTYLE